MTGQASLSLATEKPKNEVTKKKKKGNDKARRFSLVLGNSKERSLFSKPQPGSTVG